VECARVLNEILSCLRKEIVALRSSSCHIIFTDSPLCSAVTLLANEAIFAFAACGVGDSDKSLRPSVLINLICVGVSNLSPCFASCINNVRQISYPVEQGNYFINKKPAGVADSFYSLSSSSFRSFFCAFESLRGVITSTTMI
jgi:hypothetical protein